MKNLKNSKLSKKYLFIIVLLFLGVQNLVFSDISANNSADSAGSADSESAQQEHSSTQQSDKKPPATQPHIKKTRKFKQTQKNHWTIGGEKLFLFQWVNEQQMSLQWAYAFLNQTDKFAPTLLQEKINESFRNESLIYFNFHQNIIQFPYILKWGLKASAGVTRNYDVDSTYFIPISLSAMVSFQIFKNQVIVPFFEIGYSFWNVDFSESSDFFPFWGVGADISLSVFKKSLRYTLPDEYGIKDIGLSLEFRSNSSPMDFSEEKRGYFSRSLHVGVYCRF